MNAPYREQSQPQNLEGLVDPYATYKYQDDHRTRVRLLTSTPICFLLARHTILWVLRLGPQPSGATMAFDVALVGLAIIAFIARWPRRRAFAE